MKIKRGWMFVVMWVAMALPALSSFGQDAARAVGAARMVGAGRAVTNAPTGGGGGGGTSTISEIPGGAQRAAGTSNNGVDSGTLAFPGNVTSGDLLVVGGSVWGATAAPTSIVVTDTRGTSYTVILGTVGGGLTWRTFVAYGVAPTTGASTVTVNPAGADGTHSFSFSVDEFTGQQGSPLDADGGTGPGSAPSASSTITTVWGNAIVVSVTSHDGGNSNMGTGSGYALIGKNDANSANQCHLMQFQQFVTPGLKTVDSTIPGETAPYAIQKVSFR